MTPLPLHPPPPQSSDAGDPRLRLARRRSRNEGENNNHQPNPSLVPILRRPPGWTRGVRSTDVPPTRAVAPTAAVVIEELDGNDDDSTKDESDGDYGVVIGEDDEDDGGGEDGIVPALQTFSSPLLPSSSSTLPRTIGGDDADDAAVVCPTCRTNEARYVCPRCDAPYCSAACYRIHDAPLRRPGFSSSAPPAAGRGGGEEEVVASGGRCTEGFYRERVAAASGLDAKDDAAVESMRDILNRQRNDDGGGDGAAFDGHREGGEGGAQSSSPTLLSDDDLIELAECVARLEEAEERYGTDDDNGREAAAAAVEEAWEAIPPRLREAFERAVAAGDAARLLGLCQWRPWWFPDLLPSAVDASGGNEDDTNLEGDGPNLDERILSIPPFSTLRGTSQGETPRLEYNTLDILYGTALTLRLYNGLAGARNKSLSSRTTRLIDEEEAARNLLASSAVLGEDARYGSAAETLVACTARGTELLRSAAGGGGIGDAGVAKWSVLCRDAAALVRRRRWVLRALLVAADILAAGGKAASKRKRRRRRAAQGGEERALPSSSNRDPVEMEMRRAAKKAGYYLSWCAAHWTEGVESELSEDILGFIADWHRSGVDEADDPIMVGLSRVKGTAGTRMASAPDRTASSGMIDSRRNVVDDGVELMTIRSSRSIT